MYNFNGNKNKRRVFALIGLILIAAMMLTTLVSAL